MDFLQNPPQLANQYEDDAALRGFLDRCLPPEVLAAAEEPLRRLGALAGGELYAQQLAERTMEPRLVQWDGWGRRVDRIELTPLWERARTIAAREGLVALAHTQPYARHSRLVQFALVHLFTPSTDMFACPLAMSDGAARAIQLSGNRALTERALPHLLSREPALFWTSGQWMTETIGGSDVSQSETVARRDGDDWRLSGRKWFTSAIQSEMALTLARPQGNPPGGRGLAMFYLETRDPQGVPNGIRIDRLKDKLGTRKLPTAELTLEGARAQPVGELGNGVRAISTLLNVTRVWNAVAATAYMRRAIALARSYSRMRRAFGAPLAEKPLHMDTLAAMQAEYEAGLQISFFVAELLGRAESGHASEEQLAVLRLLTPIAKLMTGKQAVAVVSEAIEAFGGAGYIEDTGLPALLRDAQVFPIWEGTTNVLALDALRAVGPKGLAPLAREIGIIVGAVRELSLVALSARAQSAVESAQAWLEANAGKDEVLMEAGARRFAMLLGRTTAAALLARQAQWSIDHRSDRRPYAAALRFAASGLRLEAPVDAGLSKILAG